MSEKNRNNLLKQSMKREWMRITSRPIYLVGTFGVMLFTFIFFTSLLDEGMPDKMPIGIVDLDNSWVSRAFIRNLDATQQANVVMKLGSFTEARQEMQKGNIYAFLLIDRNFEKKAISGKQPTISFYVNNGYLVAGSLLMKDMTYMSELASGALKQAILRKKGVTDNKIMAEVQPIAVDSHLLGNPWTNYGVYLINLLFPAVLQLMIIMMTVFAIGVELKEKTSAEWLQSANNNMFVALTGKLLPYTFIFGLLGLVSNVLLYRYMHFPMNSSIIWMCITTILYVLASQSIGVLIIGIVPVLRDGVALSAFYGLLGFTFAGFTFPIEQMVSNIQIFSYLFPIRYYFRIYSNQALLGSPIQYSAVYFAAMLLFMALPLFIFNRLKNGAIKQNYPIN